MTKKEEKIYCMLSLAVTYPVFESFHQQLETRSKNEFRKITASEALREGLLKNGWNLDDPRETQKCKK